MAGRPCTRAGVSEVGFGTTGRVAAHCDDCSWVGSFRSVREAAQSDLIAHLAARAGDYARLLGACECNDEERRPHYLVGGLLCDECWLWIEDESLLAEAKENVARVIGAIGSGAFPELSADFRESPEVEDGSGEGGSDG